MKRALLMLLLFVAAASAVERRIESVTHARHVAQITGASYWRLIQRPIPHLLGFRWMVEQPLEDESEEIQ